MNVISPDDSFKPGLVEWAKVALDKGMIWNRTGQRSRCGGGPPERAQTRICWFFRRRCSNKHHCHDRLRGFRIDAQSLSFLASINEKRENPT